MPTFFMKNIYILEACYDYEGSAMIGCYANEEKAQRKQKKIQSQNSRFEKLYHKDAENDIHGLPMPPYFGANITLVKVKVTK